MNKNRQMKIIGLVFVIIGIGGLAYPFFYLGFLTDFIFLEKAAGDYKMASESLNNQFADPVVSPSKTPDYGLSKIKNRLKIDKANVNMPLIVSNDASTLLKGGWVFEKSPTPETGGNMIVFGHRFRYLPPIANTFYNLDKVAIGDEFSLDWNDKTYKYKVSEVKVIEPNDLSVLDQSPQPQITLITCLPLFSSKQRLVVVGKMIK